MTDKKLELRTVNKEIDLDSLVRGDKVRLILSPYDKPQMVYEGTDSNGQECFIERSLLSHEIFSWRITKEDILFKEGTMVLVENYFQITKYKPSSSEYEKAEKLLEQAGLME
jgi:hypothetical protein